MLDTIILLFVSLPLKRSESNKGAIAQLGERLRGTQNERLIKKLSQRFNLKG